jgi:hypothetical protein
VIQTIRVQDTQNGALVRSCHLDNDAGAGRSICIDTNQQRILIASEIGVRVYT